MKIAIIDADLIQNINKHRFPNLACMKISGYYKELGNEVILKLDYIDLENYDKVFISKVFTETIVNKDILKLSNVEYGGTGFFYDLAIPLIDEIEHYMPDYHLYDEWVNTRLEKGDKRKSMEYYLDYSIGFTTRGCMRGCSFCVNKNSKQSLVHSCISEFLDSDRKYICMLDDNVLASKDWKKIFDDLIKTKKRFQYKQGLDERLLTKEKCDYLFNKSKWLGDYIFAFDNIKDKDIIIEKLKLIREYTSKKNIKFYVFTGYNHENINDYSGDFYEKDIEELFERIKILSHYKCHPYIMRYIDVWEAPFPYKNIYTTVSGWCNQPVFFSSMTLKEFSIAKGMKGSLWKEWVNKYEEYKYKKGVSWLAYEKLMEIQPSVREYYDFKGFSDSVRKTE